jgi:hypothetical protein
MFRSKAASVRFAEVRNISHDGFGVQHARGAP